MESCINLLQYFVILLFIVLNCVYIYKIKYVSAGA